LWEAQLETRIPAINRHKSADDFMGIVKRGRRWRSIMFR
jgi:hypothetical protein